MNKLYPPGPKPGAGGRVKNHCRKFWWCGESLVTSTLHGKLIESRLSRPDHPRTGHRTATDIRWLPKEGTA
jgi:hypothetical protein